MKWLTFIVHHLNILNYDQNSNMKWFLFIYILSETKRIEKTYAENWCSLIIIPIVLLPCTSQCLSFYLHWFYALLFSLLTKTVFSYGHILKFSFQKFYIQVRYKTKVKVGIIDINTPKKTAGTWIINMLPIYVHTYPNPILYVFNTHSDVTLPPCLQ